MYYNVSIYYYADEIQVRTYSRPVKRNDEKIIDDDILVDEEIEKDEKEVDKERSIASSYNRTKQSIYGIARANKWDYFVTLTLSPDKIDRSDIGLISKKFTQFMNNLRKRKCPDLKYIFVPELHKDGVNYHLHGLIANCDSLSFVDSGIKDHKGRTIYNFENWKYGFSTATKVSDTNKASAYITKYITKDLCTVAFGKRRYWNSKNCFKAEDVKEDIFMSDEELDNFLRDLYNRGKIKYEKSLTVEHINQRVNYYEVKL